ncbi:MAG: DUF4965 domain-containing protein [Bacilli bacterium]|nr:DUF4965 domain-containing protein [Bacilli bacterium]
MKNTLSSYPLITNDPYFSYWSNKEQLNKTDVTHWTGEKKLLTGDIVIDNVRYRFLGKGKSLIKQVNRIITPLISEYHFENSSVYLIVKFWSPLFLDNPVLLSRPTSYIDFEIRKKGNHDVKIYVNFDEAFTYDKKRDSDMNGLDISFDNYSTCFMGKRKQPLLESSGDNQRINWGYLFLSLRKEDGSVIYLENDRKSLQAEIKLNDKNKSTLVVSYDDIASLNYYGYITYGYWKKQYKDISEAICASFIDHDENLSKAEKLDKELLKRAKEAGGKPLQNIVIASYRQSIAAHKTSFDEEGNLIFVSKENFSNGCAATVDVSYPSIPLFLLYNPEFIFGMIRPILRCARLPYWIFDFSPHDAGRYPHLYGNVYGIEDRDDHHKSELGQSYPPYYLFGPNEKMFRDDRHMPVEECGNMLIMIALASKASKDTKIIENNIDLLDKWTEYLVKFGQDPGNQLCTDDFAGHLEHNANLSIKSIMGIESYAQIQLLLNNKEKYNKYHSLAKEFAKEWEKKSIKKDHTVLSFDKEDSWSMKYNLIWDNYFESDLFSEEMKENEINWYIKMQNEYGLPLDNRADYTKSDWLCWCTCLTDDISKREQLLKPLAKFISRSKSRVPFSDWYDTKTGLVVGFRARSVQGGCFAPMLFKGIK